MIEARELRLGNYLLLKGKIVKVAGIPNSMRLLIPGEQYAVDMEEFSGIPLTEEILGDWCGFEIFNAPYNEFDFFSVRGYELGGFKITMRYDNTFRVFEFYGSAIKSLHQLQNLYFDLERKELEINLKKVSNT